MKSLLLLLLLTLGLSTLSHAQGITGILGGGSESPVFTGVCGTGFNLVIESTTGTAVLAATATTLVAVTDENAQLGRVYTVAQDNGANNMRLVTFTNLDTTPVIQNNIVLAAASSPDSQGALGVHLNTRGTVDNFVFIGTGQVAPCNVTPCVHARAFNDITPGLDSFNVSADIGGGIVYSRFDQISNTAYAHYNGTSGGPWKIAKLSSSYILNDVRDIGADISGDLTSDGTSIYFTQVTGGALLVGKITITGFSAASVITYFSTGLTSGTSIVYENNVLHVGGLNGTTPFLVRMNAATGAILTTTTFGAVNQAVLSGSFQYDPVNDKLYMSTTTAGAINWHRVNPLTNVVEQSVGVAQVSNAQSQMLDVPHQRMWGASRSFGTLELTKVRLCG